MLSLESFVVVAFLLIITVIMAAAIPVAQAIIIPAIAPLVKPPEFFLFLIKVDSVFIFENNLLFNKSTGVSARSPRLFF